MTMMMVQLMASLLLIISYNAFDSSLCKSCISGSLAPMSGDSGAKMLRKPSTRTVSISEENQIADPPSLEIFKAQEASHCKEAQQSR